MNSVSRTILDFVSEFREVRIIPDTSLDSLIASSILLKTLEEHNVRAKVSLNSRLIVEAPDEPAILLGLPPLNAKTQVGLTREGSLTITSRVVKMLDEVFGVDWWDKALSIVASLYRQMTEPVDYGKILSDVGEKIVDELSKEHRLNIASRGLQIWGVKRFGLVKSLSRTLIPFAPGFTGNAERIASFLEKELKIRDLPYSKYLEYTSNEENYVKFAKTLARIYMNTGLSPEKILPRIVGEYTIVYESESGLVEFQVNELIGALLVYMSLDKSFPLSIIPLSMRAEICSQALVVYDSIIDQLAKILGSKLTGSTDFSKPVDIDEYLKRPELVEEIAGFLEKKPRDKPVSTIIDGVAVTSLRELLRVEKNPGDAYVKCDEQQICRI